LILLHRSGSGHQGSTSDFHIKVGPDALHTREAICHYEIERADSIKGLVRRTDPSQSPIAVSEYASQCAMDAEQRRSPPLAVYKPRDHCVWNAPTRDQCGGGSRRR
jgi:hypothetical protein